MERDDAFTTLLNKIADRGESLPKAKKKVGVMPRSEADEFDLGRWLYKHGYSGTASEYPDALLKAAKRHGYEPADLDVGAHGHPHGTSKKDERRDHPSNPHGPAGEGSRVADAQMAPESIPHPLVPAGADLNPVSSYWAVTNAQSYAMTMDIHQVNHPQDPDFGDSLEFADSLPDIMQGGFEGHADSAVLSGPASGDMWEFPLVPDNSTVGFGHQWGYVAFPVQSDDEVDLDSTGMEYDQHAEPGSSSGPSDNPIGNAASENLPPLSPADRPGTPATGWRRPFETRLAALEQGIDALYRQRAGAQRRGSSPGR
ncbi:hypothetical protein [Streptomyces sp. NPDC006012]|uniref:hypothetical protein n=1 Tax=Streptomyces sp. NPDC006012 TaxID=3364739 RepID=UPI00367F833B